MPKKQGENAADSADASLTIEGSEQQQEDTNVIDFQTATAESREVRVQNSTVAMKEYRAKFQAILESLNDAGLKLREQTEVSFRLCGELVKVLQSLRRLTNNCLEFFHNGNALIATSYYIVINSLHILDGEKTARLILEVDLFERLLLRTSGSLAQERERIKMHVDLQSSLREESQQVRELIGQIEKLLEEVQSRSITPMKG